jgi:hypothetical protein
MEVDYKRDNHDLVTRYDRLAEDRIREAILERVPDSVIVGEERGTEGSGDIRWYVDPIDGTANFVSGFAYFCTSIGAVVDDQLVAGAVLDPIANNLFTADLTGIRRDQTVQRAETPVVAFDEHFGVAKIAPLAAWSMDEVDEYVRRNDVPLNPLLSMGYRSIGCEPCTRPVAPGEDARAGRWPDMDKTECGLHFVGGAVKRANP